MRSLLVIALLALLFLDRATTSKRSVLPEPGMLRPRLRFSARSTPNFRQPPTRASDLPGAISRWTVLQWKKRQLLGPDARRQVRDSDADARLGAPTAVFETRSGESRLKIFAEAQPPVYELFSKGGELDGGGGTNLFLSARSGRRIARFDRPITYDVTLRLAQALVDAPQKRSLRDGTVLAQVLSGFVLELRQAHVRHPTILFLQIKHADSRGRQPDYRSCRLRRDGTAIAIYSGTLQGDDHLRFLPDPLPVHFHYLLNRYLRHALEAPFPCNNGAPGWVPPPEAGDPINWRIREMYVGLETQDTNLIALRNRGVKAGDVEAAVQISGLTVIRDRFGAPEGDLARPQYH